MMNEDGLAFSEPITQLEAELWIQSMENHFRSNLVARKYEVQYALQYFTKCAQPGGKRIRPYKDVTEQKLGRNSR